MLNQIINGDCLDVLKDVESESVDLLLTDPPFNMAYSGRGKINKFDVFANDDMSQDDHSDWLDAILKEIHRVLKKNSSAYIFVDFRNYARFYNLLQSYFKIKHCIVWDKMSIGMGQYYRFQHEFIIYAHKGNGGGFYIDVKNVPDILRHKRVRPLTHPTQKPTDLLKTLLEHSSKEGDVVLDPFAGSFSTAVACKEMNRNFICCELDAEFCKVGSSRLNIETICHQSRENQTQIWPDSKMRMGDGKTENLPIIAVESQKQNQGN